MDNAAENPKTAHAATASRTPEVPLEPAPTAPDSILQESIPAEDSQKPAVIRSTIKSTETETSKPKKDTPQHITQRLSSKHDQIRELSPQTPSWVEKLFTLAYRWFIDGNTFVRVGIVVLFFGFSFLFKEAYTRGLIDQYFPIELRLAFAAIFAFVLLFLGWRLSHKKKTYGLLLQSAAIGILYLTTYAAFALYDLIPSMLAFVLFALLCVFSIGLAVMQDSKNLAIFSSIGGFLTPILVSTGSNNYIGLFSFYALLNTGIFAVYLKKSWRLLNLIGFVFTFSVASFWGSSGGYQPEFFATTEPFLIFFFLLYVAVTVLFAIREQVQLKNYVDSSLLFGVPILGFTLQALMVKDYEYGLAISAFVLSLFYILLSYWIQKKYAEKLQLLTESFLALGVIFATLSIPFALDSVYSSTAWVLEGAGIIWIGLRQNQEYRRLFGLVIQVFGTFLFAQAMWQNNQAIELVSFTTLLISGTLIMLGLTFSAWALQRHQESIRFYEKKGIFALLIYGAIWFFVALCYKHVANIANPIYPLHLLAGSVFMLSIYTLLTKFQQWKQAALLGIGMLLPALVSLTYPGLAHPAQYGGGYVWAIFFVLFFILLSLTRKLIPLKQSNLLHIATAAIIAGLLFWEAVWLLLLGTTVLAAFFVWLGHRYDYKEMDTASLILLPAMAVSMLASIVLSGNIVGLPSIGLPTLSITNIGAYLWPLAFAISFVLLNVNRTLKTHPYMRYAHYFIGILIIISLAWVGLGALLLGLAILAILFNLIGHRYQWAYMRELSQGLPLVMAGVAFFAYPPDFHNFSLSGLESIPLPFENGYILWPLGFAAFILILNQWKNTEYAPKSLLPLLFLSIVLFIALATSEMGWHLLDSFESGSGWFLSALPTFTLLALWGIMKWSRWPMTQYGSELKDMMGLLATPALLGWSLWTLFTSGDSAPLPWIPVLNPLDIMQLTVIFTLAMFFQHYKSKISGKDYQTLLLVLAGFGFIWLNMEVLRAISHWTPIPWQWSDIVRYPYSQTALVVLWTLVGISLIFISGKRQSRTIWLIGAGLLAVVVLKLFLFDFRTQSGISRILSFISVGALLLIVGYLSPLPPAKKETEST